MFFLRKGSYMLMGGLLLLLSCTAQRPKANFRIAYQEEYSVEQILNRDFPNRKASPKKDIIYDATGFAENRLFHVPKIGEHPRILFASSDIPRIKKQLQQTQSGMQLLQHVKNELAKGIDSSGTREYQIFEACRQKNFTKIAAVWDDATLRDGSKWHHRDAFRISLMLKAWMALIEGDEGEGKKVAEALTGYALFLEPKMDKINQDPDNNVWWKFGHKIFGWLNASIPFAYDWTYNFMNAEQKSTVRRLLSKVIVGKYNLGMDLPDHWINWNHVGGEMYFPLYALAIEGEEGYDPRIYKRSVEVARSFLDYGISEKGMSKESIGYHTGGMTHLSTFMIAAANRGDVLFTHPHYRNQIDWYLYRLQPYGREWVSRGDVGFSEPNAEPIMVHKYFYPEDPKVDYVFRNLSCNRPKGTTSKHTNTGTQGVQDGTAQSGNFMKGYFMELMLLCAEDPIKNEEGDYSDYQYGKTLNLKNTFFDEERGSMSTKTGWGENETQLQFDGRTDTRFASHDHSDRGSFDLSALGRLWTREDSRLIASNDHSVVLIDGIGQGYFPTFARWHGFFDTEITTFGVSDTKYAYSWRWEKEVNMWDMNDARLSKPYFEWIKKKLVSFNREGWEYDPSPEVKRYYEEYLDGNPLMWHGEDSWIIRKLFNPVERAFRTCGLVRGKNPYVLVIDDIQKDESEHLYEWLMALPVDIGIESMDLKSENEQDIILKEEKGSRRLLVRILNCNGLEETGMEIYNANHNNYDRVKRLSISARTVSPDFKILLYPMKDNVMPKTYWNDAKTVLNIEFDGQKDEVIFKKTVENKTIFQLSRDSESILNTETETPTQKEK